MSDHEVEIVYFDEYHVTVPAEVCTTCSDMVSGHWVPAPWCPEANRKMIDRYERQGF